MEWKIDPTIFNLQRSCSHLDGLEVVQHGVNDPHILGPGSLEEDVPGHGEDPADAGDPPHLLLQDDLGVVVGAGVVQTSPQEVPIHPDTGILELRKGFTITLSWLLSTKRGP